MSWFNRAALACALLLIGAGAEAQCPASNAYPFVQGCPLPAAGLNAALDQRQLKPIITNVTAASEAYFVYGIE